MLLHRMSLPSTTSDGVTVAVLLHGRGSDEEDLLALRPMLPPEWVLVTPRAPHPGGPWGYGPGWAWYRYMGEDLVEDEGLRTSLDGLDELLGALPGLLGAKPGHVVLGGFSQGGTTSMVYALTRPGRVGAVLNFSGFLPDTELLTGEHPAPQATPIFWGHGTGDPNIPHRLATKGRGTLSARGVPVTGADYPIGHWIDPEEIADAVDFIHGSNR